MGAESTRSTTSTAHINPRDLSEQAKERRNCNDTFGTHTLGLVYHAKAAMPQKTGNVYRHHGITQVGPSQVNVGLASVVLLRHIP